ncbi:hypothetical protein HDU96_003835 [Phlyctochytrium bullatum]|nr:hypothetical protein HDU96_003835 [Phlyctochytrium bullatum]
MDCGGRGDPPSLPANGGVSNAYRKQVKGAQPTSAFLPIPQVKRQSASVAPTSPMTSRRSVRPITSSTFLAPVPCPAEPALPAAGEYQKPVSNFSATLQQLAPLTLTLLGKAPMKGLAPQMRPKSPASVGLTVVTPSAARPELATLKAADVLKAMEPKQISPASREVPAQVNNEISLYTVKAKSDLRSTSTPAALPEILTFAAPVVAPLSPPLGNESSYTAVEDTGIATIPLNGALPEVEPSLAPSDVSSPTPESPDSINSLLAIETVEEQLPRDLSPTWSEFEAPTAVQEEVAPADGGLPAVLMSLMLDSRHAEKPAQQENLNETTSVNAGGSSLYLPPKSIESKQTPSMRILDREKSPYTAITDTGSAAISLHGEPSHTQSQFELAPTAAHEEVAPADGGLPAVLMSLMLDSRRMEKPAQETYSGPVSDETRSKPSGVGILDRGRAPHKKEDLMTCSSIIDMSDVDSSDSLMPESEKLRNTTPSDERPFKQGKATQKKRAASLAPKPGYELGKPPLYPLRRSSSVPRFASTTTPPHAGMRSGACTPEANVSDTELPSASQERTRPNGGTNTRCASQPIPIPIKRDGPRPLRYSQSEPASSPVWHTNMNFSNPDSPRSAVRQESSFEPASPAQQEGVIFAPVAVKDSAAAAAANNLFGPVSGPGPQISRLSEMIDRSRTPSLEASDARGKSLPPSTGAPPCLSPLASGQYIQADRNPMPAPCTSAQLMVRHTPSQPVSGGPQAIPLQAPVAVPMQRDGMRSRSLTTLPVGTPQESQNAGIAPSLPNGLRRSDSAPAFTGTTCERSEDKKIPNESVHASSSSSSPAAGGSGFMPPGHPASIDARRTPVGGVAPSPLPPASMNNGLRQPIGPPAGVTGPKGHQLRKSESEVGFAPPAPVPNVVKRADSVPLISTGITGPSRQHVGSAPLAPLNGSGGGMVRTNTPVAGATPTMREAPKQVPGKHVREAAAAAMERLGIVIPPPKSARPVAQPTGTPRMANTEFRPLVDATSGQIPSSTPHAKAEATGLPSDQPRTPMTQVMAEGPGRRVQQAAAAAAQRLGLDLPQPGIQRRDPPPPVVGAQANMLPPAPPTGAAVAPITELRPIVDATPDQIQAPTTHVEAEAPSRPVEQTHYRTRALSTPVKPEAPSQRVQAAAAAAMERLGVSPSMTASGQAPGNDTSATKGSSMPKPSNRRRGSQPLFTGTQSVLPPPPPPMPPSLEAAAPVPGQSLRMRRPWAPAQVRAFSTGQSTVEQESKKTGGVLYEIVDGRKRVYDVPARADVAATTKLSGRYADGISAGQPHTRSTTGSWMNTFWNALTTPVGAVWRGADSWVRSTLLPIGYPGSVHPCYERVHWLQAVETFLWSTVLVLCTQSMLSTLGCEANAAANAGGALGIRWMLKDGIGEVAKLLFIQRFARSFDSHPRTWKVVGEVVGLAGSGLMVGTGAVGEEGWWLGLAAAGCGLKAIHFSIYNATHMTFTRNFALQGNVGDVTAKDDSQMTVAHLLGLLFGIALLNFSHQLGFLYLYFAVIAPLHFWATWCMVAAAKFEVLNGARARVLADAFVRTGDEGKEKVLGMREVDGWLRGFGEWVGGAVDVCKVGMGVKVEKCFGDVGMMVTAVEVLREERYLIGLDTKCYPAQFGITYHQDATHLDVLKSLLHVAKLRTLLRAHDHPRFTYGAASTPGTSPAVGLDVFERELVESKDWTREAFPRFMVELEAAGWRTDAVFWEDGGVRAMWGEAAK